MLTPTFHFKILHGFNGVFNDQATIMVNRLQKMADKGPFNIFPFITLCALDIICGMLTSLLLSSVLAML